MNIPEINQSSFEMHIPKAGNINSSDLNAVLSGLVSDVTNIVTFLNEHVIKILNSIESDFDPNTDKLDGTKLLVDTNATNTSDYGIFYNKFNNSPISIKDALLQYVQILANLNNGMREGVKIGSSSSPEPIGPTNGQIISPWPYDDKVFFPMLFEFVGTDVSPVNDLTIYVNSSNQIVIDSPSDRNIFGYIWHPVLAIS